MTISKPPFSSASSRASSTRRRVLEAAERLLRTGSAAFSMRELAAEADVSFATPFNQFGSKIAIMHALSAERIAAMGERFDASEPTGDAVERVFAAVRIAADVMLAEPDVSRAVIGTLGAATDAPGQVYLASRALWARALGAADGIDPELIDLARSTLPDQLAVAFRGVLSFWTAREIGDAELVSCACVAAATLLLGFVVPERRGAVLDRLHEPHAGDATPG
jgi:AcrR family transcriptional regulator